MEKRKQTIALLVFLLGIFMGAIDTGIVSPARTVIQAGFGVDQNMGVWMITIYTLAYAVSMPIVSKLSDRFGRKRIYLLSISVFIAGSVLCGLTNFYGSFGLFLAARVIQAIGGGGIVPIATAFIGQSFPPEKRGTALGFVGAIYGIATILGPTMGSSVLDFAGSSHWGWLFFINAPIGLLIIVLGMSLGENKADIPGKMDIPGSIALGVVILSLMYALTNFDFFHFGESLQKMDVWPYLLIFVLVLPVFVYLETKAEDPILNMNYFKDTRIAITLAISFIVGCGLMGVVFVPQFAENILKLPSGRGGYLVTLMSVFAGFSAPFGGKLIDKYSAKLVMLLGFGCTAIGTAFLGLYVVNNPAFFGILIGLAFIGLGMGFTMGTPLNYLMLSYVKDSEASSGLSTLSLIRSIGVTISPNLMITFIATAGKNVQPRIQEVLPALTPPAIPGMEKMTAGMGSANMDMAGQLPAALLEKFKSADITTITDVTKEFASTMFDTMGKKFAGGGSSGGTMQQGVSAMAGAGKKIGEMMLNWKQEYINAIEAKRSLLENIFQSTLNEGFRNMFITAAVVAVAGLLLTLLLKTRKAGKEVGKGKLAPPAVPPMED
jgi:EmrB/QacA subfamily drug resistance transporter